MHQSKSFLWQNSKDSFQRDLIYVALLVTNLIYMSWTQKIMSNTISKGREEKLSKHGAGKAQNRVKSFPNLSTHLSTWPKDIPVLNEAAGEFREQK